jgi:hypothetical protein
LKTDELTLAFQGNAEKAALKYSGKVIQVSGKLAETKTDDKGLVTVILEGSTGTTVSCILEQPLVSAVNKGEILSLKGFCSGWDDLFSEVKLHSGVVVIK